MSPLPAWLAYFDYAGCFVFAATGALAAARNRHDIVTFFFFAAVTGLGGGSLRDLLIGAPVFWVSDPGYLATCAAASGFVWLLGDPIRRLRGFLWLDAIGLSAYAVIGAGKAWAMHVPALICVLMGVLTATFGGVLRDVLAGEPSILLRRDIYVTAALSGAATFVAMVGLGAPHFLAIVFGAAAGLGVRAGAILFGWSLPSYTRATDEPS